MGKNWEIRWGLARLDESGVAVCLGVRLYWVPVYIIMTTHAPVAQLERAAVS